jgi:inner membrane protein
MLFKTHILFAFLFALLGIQIFHPSNQILFLLLALFGGLLPDIDHPKSKIGKYFKHFNLFEHRGFMHSFLVLPLIAAILFFVFNLPQFALPIIVGYISHLLSDLITKEGIMPLHPLTRFRLHGFIKTGGLIEVIIFLALIFVVGYVLLTM